MDRHDESFKKMEDQSLREIAFVDRTRGDTAEFHELWNAIEEAGYEVAAVQGESEHGFGVFVRDGDNE